MSSSLIEGKRTPAVYEFTYVDPFGDFTDISKSIVPTASPLHLPTTSSLTPQFQTKPQKNSTIPEIVPIPLTNATYTAPPTVLSSPARGKLEKRKQSRNGPGNVYGCILVHLKYDSNHPETCQVVHLIEEVLSSQECQVTIESVANTTPSYYNGSSLPVPISTNPPIPLLSATVSWRFYNIDGPTLTISATRERVDMKDFIPTYFYIARVILPKWVLRCWLPPIASPLTGCHQSLQFLVEHLDILTPHAEDEFVPKSDLVVSGLQFLRKHKPALLQSFPITGFIWECLFYVRNEKLTQKSLGHNFEADRSSVGMNGMIATDETSSEESSVPSELLQEWLDSMTLLDTQVRERQFADNIFERTPGKIGQPLQLLPSPTNK